MHILFFTYDTIYPIDSGGKNRAYNLIKYAKNGVSISLFSFMREGYDLSSLDEIKKLGIRHIEVFPRRRKWDLRNLGAFLSPRHSVFYPLYYDRKIAATLLSFIQEQKVDLVHFESFYTGFYLSDRIAQMGVKQIYGSENIEYLLYQDGLKSFNPVLRTVLSKEVNKIKSEEINMAGNSDAVLAVTGEEVKYFRNHNKNSYLIPNGVDINNFPPLKVDTTNRSCSLLFVGNFTYFPNRDALLYFFESVWPLLDLDRFKLTVVGRGGKKLRLDSDKVEFVEYVADIYDVYAASDVFVSPMRFGGGTNFKVLEAMAAGIPVVALAEKVKGLEAKNNKHLLIAKDAKEFAACLVRLSENLSLRETLGKNARELVKTEFAWEGIGKRLYNVWKDLIDEKS